MQTKNKNNYAEFWAALLILFLEVAEAFIGLLIKWLFIVLGLSAGIYIFGGVL